MPLRTYGVLRGRPTNARVEVADDTPHFQIRVSGGGVDFRVSVNVKSQMSPSELLFLVDEQFRHPITASLSNLRPGFTPVESRPGGSALDYIRGNLFNRVEMQPLPANLVGPSNDLNEHLDHLVRRAVDDPSAQLYACGARWGPEPSTPDKVFGFRPGNGIHDIHMNQGNVGRFTADDGVWQDGGLFIHFPDEDRWAAVFLAFQSQAWHTSDLTGHTIPTGPQTGTGNLPGPEEPDFRVRIVAALVNPRGPAPEAETLTLLNASPEVVDLTGWALKDRLKRGQTLAGTLRPGDVLVVPVAAPVQLGNDGGIITLLDRAGLKVDGVSYTKQQAQREGWTIVF